MVDGEGRSALKGPGRVAPMPRREPEQGPVGYDAQAVAAPAPLATALPGGNAAVARLMRSSSGGPPNEDPGEAPPSQGAGPLDPRIAASIEAERARGGAPLPAGLRAEMEHGFGVDLSQVRVHTGPRAAALNRSVQAEAFTTGADIFLGGTGLHGDSPSDRRLLAHELTHVVQQAAGEGTPGTVSHPGDPAEVEAERVATALTTRPAGGELGPGAVEPAISGAPAGVARRLAAGHPAGNRALARLAVQRVGDQPGAHQPGAETDQQTLSGPLTLAAVQRHEGPVVQRHSSWEHAMLGDVPPGELVSAVDNITDPPRDARADHDATAAAGGPEAATAAAPVDAPASGGRLHVLLGELRRVEFFSTDPGADPRSRFPDIHWIRLSGSGLWVSYGELNALADYLPDPQTIDTLPAERITPVLQRMRVQIADQCRAVMGMSGTWFAGAAWSPISTLSSAGGEVAALESATQGLGANSYQGLLARNACHFAPESWQRWSQYHNEARRLAEAAHAAASSPGQAQRLQHDAWVTNGYGDHFLQDSFASGHLVNKTLVMQWFGEYLTQMPLLLRPTVGVPGADVLQSMSDPAHAWHGQGGIAGRDLYGGPDLHTTDSQDRAGGSTATDPQSAQERASRAGRVAGSGVTASGTADLDQAYDQYGEFLNSGYLQSAARAAHDLLNRQGIEVANAAGDVIRVGGDDTMLTRSDAAGVAIAAEASRRSRQAIADLIDQGASPVTQEGIFELVPTVVVVGGQRYPLQDWNDQVLRELCWSTVFPAVLRDPANDAVRLLSPELKPSGVVH